MQKNTTCAIAISLGILTISPILNSAYATEKILDNLSVEEEVVVPLNLIPTGDIVINRTTVKLKMSDQRFGVIKGMSIDGKRAYQIAVNEYGEEVDIDAILNEDKKAYFEKYGKINPTLYNKMVAGHSDEKFPVVLWLAVTEEKVDKSKFDAQELQKTPQSPVGYRQQNQNAQSNLRNLIEQELQVEVQAKSNVVPTLYLELTSNQIQELNQWDEIGGIFLHETEGFTEGFDDPEENLESQLIKDSYIITFKEPDEGALPIVDPPDQEVLAKAKKGEIEIPVGEPSSGQSKQEIADKIDLNGEVLAIFDTINAIHVKMDAQEAHRLSLDERVLNVEQDMIVTTAAITSTNLAANSPTFQDSILLLPSVNSLKKGGEYQNVQFKLTTQGEWQLLDFVIPQELQHIDQVEIIKTDSLPIQVFLKVIGNFRDGCQKMGQISYQVLENKFDIWMYSTMDEKFPSNEFACTQGFVPFTHIIPLPVYALKKGEYEYSANGLHTGTFELAEDNKF